MKKLLILVGAIAILGAALFVGFGSASGADHGDAPLAKADHQLDLADVFAFAGSNGNLVLAMTVNGLAMPGETPSFGSTDEGKLYQFKIDNNGDAIPDVSLNVSFSSLANGGTTQHVTVRKAVGDQANTLSNGGTVMIEGDTTTSGAPPAIASNSTNDKLFAGLRDDPFFFDFNAFKAGLKFRNPGNDFFEGLNVSAIVLELDPSEILDGQNDTSGGVWAITSKDGTVIDRDARPAIATVFIPEGNKDAFNQTKPQDDVAVWKSTVVATLTSLGSDPALADTLLPDILTFDTSKPLNFLNGRALSDDVIDAELQLITGNPAATDNVANDSTFLSSFPYLGVPNTAPAPTPIAGGATPTSSAPPPPPSSPVAAATRVGVTAPNTGTGDSGNGSGTNMLIWLALGIAGVAAVTAGGTLVARGRGR